MLQAMNQKGQKGFTLVELMIVVAIIGILAAIAIPQFAQYRIRGFNASAQSDLRNLTTAQEAFFADWQSYGRTGVAATALNTPVATLLTGPSTTATIIAQWAQNANRQLAIGLGNAVSTIAVADTSAVSYTAVAKHLQGNTIYGVDSDSSALYRNQLAKGPGVALEATDNIAPDSTKDVFNGVENWFAM